MGSQLKVGIITFHRAANYGAMLQCFALKQCLKSLGYESTQVVDYRSPAIERCYEYKWKKAFKRLSLTPRGIRCTISQLAYIYMSKKRLRRFRKFEKNYIAPSKLPYKYYDIIVFGSDQIWNTGITQNDDTYFGDLGPNKVRKISYAGSLGHGDVEIFKSKVNLLKQFNALGVRETQLASILDELGMNSFTCLDPTLLMTSKNWLRALNLPKNTKTSKPTLLVYCIRDKQRTLEAARSIAKKINFDLELLEASDTLNVHGIKNKASYYGPREFVKCFHEADYIITDSFHGTVFSILFHKPFVSCLLNDGRDGRAESLLAQIGLLSQFQEPENITPNSFVNIDKKASEIKINYLREKSLKYLSDSVLYIQNN